MRLLMAILGFSIAFIGFRWLDRLFPGLTNPPAAIKPIIKQF